MPYSEQFNHSEFSIACSNELYARITDYFDRIITNQGVVIGLYKPCSGKLRFSALIHEVIFPNRDEPDEDYFNRALTLALNAHSGIVIIPYNNADSNFYLEFITEILTSTQLPLVQLNIVDKDNVKHGSFWLDIERHVDASNVRIIGKQLDVYYNDSLNPKPQFREIYKRTITVWGEENHAKLTRLRIGIAGLGSVGSIVAETLSRIGVTKFMLIDFDEIQEHNLDRLLGATYTDIGALKVDVAERQINLSHTAESISIIKVPYGITEEIGFKNALDCDVIFSCVDRPWARQVLNVLAYNCLISVVDGGLQVRLSPDSLIFDNTNWQLQTVGPDKICLECLNVYAPADVHMEREGKLDDTNYINGLPEDHDLKRNENIFPFSTNLASLEVLQLIAHVTGIGDVHYFGRQRYSYRHGYISVADNLKCKEGCYFHDGVAMSNAIFPYPYGVDYAAEIARKRQAEH